MMKKAGRWKWFAALGLLGVFVLWTAALCRVDVQPIGPLGTEVGFAGLNGAVHERIGVHLALYTVTDILSLVPLGMIGGFGLMGLMQWVRRRSLRRVDADLLSLGGFYLVVLAIFGFFERFVINYRPVLIDGRLEASYPSSTTMLVLCVMPTAMLLLRRRIKHRKLRRIVLGGMVLFTVCMVVGRLLSGVHWVSDIIGGVLLSGGLVLLYAAVCSTMEHTDL